MGEELLRRLAEFSHAGAGPPSALAVVPAEVLRDRARVLGLDWRAESLGHLRHYRLPPLLVEERRIEGNVVEAVARHAIGAHLVHALPVLQLHLLLARTRERRGERADRRRREADDLHHATSRRMRGITLW